jgi:hypothetical protein
MSRVSFVLFDHKSRDEAACLCETAPKGTYVEFIEPDDKRTDAQNRKMWPMLTEISQQIKWPDANGVELSPNDYKLMLLDGLGHEMRLVPNINKTGFVNLGRSSSQLKKREFIQLIELIYAFGAQHGVKFREPKAAAMARIFGEPADATPSGERANG